MRQQLIWLAGAGAAWLSGTYLLAAMLGVVVGASSVLVDIRWQPPRATFISPVNRPRPVTRNGQLLVAGVVALFGIGLLCVVALAWPLAGYPVARLFGFYVGGLGLGMALAMLLTESRTRESHNRWLAAMNPQLDSELKS